MKQVFNGSRFSIHLLDLGFLGWVFKLIVGSRDSILRVHIIWYQSKVSNQVLFYLLFLAYLILELHCSRLQKRKRKVAAELHCSSVCVGLNLLFKSLCWLKLLVLEFVLAQISYSFDCDQISCWKKKKKKSENFLWALSLTVFQKLLFFFLFCFWFWFFFLFFVGIKKDSYINFLVLGG